MKDEYQQKETRSLKMKLKEFSLKSNVSCFIDFMASQKGEKI
jgi:hypothetical protein